jgi:hypothetical protein
LTNISLPNAAPALDMPGDEQADYSQLVARLVDGPSMANQWRTVRGMLPAPGGLLGWQTGRPATKLVPCRTCPMSP